MNTENNDFIRQLRQGNPSAQQRLLASCGPRIFRLLRRMISVQEDAEEVYQDVFIKALRNIDTFERKKASLATWLSRIAYHEALNFLRRTQPLTVSIDEQNMDVGDEMAEEPGDAEIAVQHLEKAIALLPIADQTLLSMFYTDGMSLQDIAYVTGSNPSTIGSRLSRIRKRIYRICQNNKK